MSGTSGRHRLRSRTCTSVRPASSGPRRAPPRGHAETTIDLASAAGGNSKPGGRRPTTRSGTRGPVAGAGVRSLPARAGRSSSRGGSTRAAELADRLFARVRENVDNEAVEIMWGAPGTMLAARAMLDWTGEERWADAWRESAEAVWQPRDADGLWTNRLYGETFRSLGPRTDSSGTSSLSPAPRPAAGSGSSARPGERSGSAGLREDGLANWPSGRAGRRPSSLQWCDGAPGIVSATASVPGRGAPPVRRELDLAGGPARDGEGIRHLSRHGRERLRVPQGLRAHRRRAVARAGAPVCDARARPGRAARDRPLLAVDGRRGCRALRRRLHRGVEPVSGGRSWD